jgi:hypothetical protein
MVPKTRLASKADNNNNNQTSTPTRTLAMSETDIQTQLRLNHPDSPLSDILSALSSPSSSISMTSPPISSTSSSAGSSDDNYNLSDSDADTPTCTPQLVAAIENELGITRLKGNKMRDLIATLMRDADLLGNMNFKTNKAECKESLRPIFARVLEELDFVVGAKLSGKRVSELMLARAMVVNRNEVHNRYMVATGRVKQRADGRAYVNDEKEEEVVEERQQDDVSQASGEENGDVQQVAEDDEIAQRQEEEGVQQIGDEKDGVQQVAQDDEIAQQEEEVQQASDGHDMVIDSDNDQAQPAVKDDVMSTANLGVIDETGPRPSIVAATLGDMSLDVLATQPEVALAPGSSIQVGKSTPQPEPEVKARPEAPKSRITPAQLAMLSTVFYPTSFLIRVAGSTASTATLISECTDPAHTGPITINSLRFDHFMQVVSRQLGYDVRGRISAALPFFLKFLPEDSFVPLSNEATWKAVLQAWHSSRRTTCEFVVDREGMQS